MGGLAIAALQTTSQEHGGMTQRLIILQHTIITKLCHRVLLHIIIDVMTLIIMKIQHLILILQFQKQYHLVRYHYLYHHRVLLPNYQ